MVAARKVHAWVGGFLACAFVLALAAPLADPSANGVWQAKERGCYCHAPDPSSAVGFTVTGLPGRYAAGANYTINITVSFTDVGTSANKSIGGFFLEASEGRFEVPDGMADLVQLSGLQATHTKNGSKVREWSVRWVAPNETGHIVTFDVDVNTANGNGSETFGSDHWTRKTIRIGVGDEPEVTAPGAPNPPLALETYGVLIAGAAFGAFALYTFYSVRSVAKPQTPDNRVRPQLRKRRK